MGSREFARGRRIVARLPHGGDLAAEIGAVADTYGMVTAEVRAIGALQRARLAFYDQASQTYREFAVDDPVELLALVGNISRRDGATAVHAHATLGRPDGTCVGGHVVSGCTIFACELVLQELVGDPLERERDPQTGLTLWRGL
jgi:predicted DNA-binding protein with PD1-like motif